MSFVSELFRRFSLADFHSASVHTRALTNEWLRDIDGTTKETMKREQKSGIMFLFLQEKSVALFWHPSRLSRVISASPDLFSFVQFHKKRWLLFLFILWFVCISVSRNTSTTVLSHIYTFGWWWSMFYVYLHTVYTRVYIYVYVCACAYSSPLHPTQ